MTVSSWLAQAELALKGASIPTARLDCLVMLEDATGRDRGWLLAHPDHPLDTLTVALLETWVAKRYTHQPLAYIRGKAEFYGRNFRVNAHTLVPRPETETMIDLLKALPLPEKTTVLDIGTGSGCIAITIALELPRLTVLASDIDRQALTTARSNAAHLQAAVTFSEGNLLDNAPSCDVIATNLPYVPDEFHINTAATHEPKHALFGGQDGLDLYRKLFEQLSGGLANPRFILTEALPMQHDEMTRIAKAAGYEPHMADDFIQVFSA